ncbi:hypothetical protein ACEPAH_2974 [Sanghuangporus vaninii]
MVLARAFALPALDSTFGCLFLAGIFSTACTDITINSQKPTSAGSPYISLRYGQSTQRTKSSLLTLCICTS